MGVSSSTYYGLTRVREVSPEAQDWAATDRNPELLSLLLKAFESHTHSATAALTYPGYHVTTPVLPTLTEYTTGGVLQPGTTISVRMSYVNALGLETEASSEKIITLAAAAERPLAPVAGTPVAANPGLPGGTYIYAITKKKGTGETVISDIITVNVPFDQTYSVTLTFDAINTYADGTTGLNIYRSTGLNSAFQLVTTISTISQTTFTDTNVIPAQNATAQPPSTTTFDAAKKVRIDWTTMLPSYPTGASKLRIYVSQQPGQWSVAHLLKELDLSTSPAKFLDYLGTEALAPGWPKSTSEVPASPPKVDLSTQTSQSSTVTFTNTVDFGGNTVAGLSLERLSGAPSTNLFNGRMYYDTTLNTVRAYINGAWTVWGTAGTGGANYTHPLEESGGHLANNIRFVTGAGATTVKTILDRIADATGNRKQAQQVTRNVLASSATTTSTTPVTITSASVSFTPQFSGQYLDIGYTDTFIIATYGATVTAGIEFNGVLRTDTLQSFTAGSNQFQTGVCLRTLIQASGSGSQAIAIRWYVTEGSVSTVAGRGCLTVAAMF